jgi:kynurenine formamidase
MFPLLRFSGSSLPSISIADQETPRPAKVSDMDGTQLLGQLASALASGAVEVVDLSAPLGPDTPLIKLPPEIGKNTPPIEIHAISHYDKDGPYWAWNWLKLGEHSGTHFDAPVHWISGKDHPNNTTDTIPAKNFVGPACVIDCSAEAAKNHDFLLTVDGVKAWEKTHGDVPPNSWVLMRTDWYKRNNSEAKFLNVDDKGPHSPGPTAETIHYLIAKGVMGWGSETVGTDAGSARILPGAHLHAPGTRPRRPLPLGCCPRLIRAAEDRQRHRQRCGLATAHDARSAARRHCRKRTTRSSSLRCSSLAWVLSARPASAASPRRSPGFVHGSSVRPVPDGATPGRP